MDVPRGPSLRVLLLIALIMVIGAIGAGGMFGYDAPDKTTVSGR